MEERERADEKKNEFLATLAHELRNPLAPIRSSLELLRLSSAYPKIAAVCEVVERQVSHMVRLVDDLMEVSRITRGKIELRKEAVDLATIIKTAVETSRPLLDSARHELTMTLSAEPVVLDADPVRLAQVFSNLLNNAAKYTEPGGRISIDVRSEPGSVVVTISDNGIGIPLHALETVFEMFSQVPAKDNRAQSGLGIGLALARSLVEMHGGTLTAISPGPGQGSSFMVRLPVPDRESTVINPSATNSLAIHGAPRILVVDDNQDAANALGTFLEALGGNVRIAYDGRSALNACLDFHPQIVFLDLGMPGMDGYEVARRIRAGVGEGELCVVALTGWGQEQDRVKASQAGFDHHLTKPADPADIVELVNHPPRCATAGKFESWRIGPSM
jgi:CheY-like chemotaxis protein